MSGEIVRMVGSQSNSVHSGLDSIYVTASRRDARFTRMCVASIRYFYPDAPIKLLKGGTLQVGLEDELRKFWNVSAADIEDRPDWGYGFVKLEPLFAEPGQRFMVLDSDLVMAGKVLDHWTSASPQFVVDDEYQTEDAVNSTYYDWREVRAIDPEAKAPPCVFNTGQWFGTSGVLSRADFAPWLDWSGPVPKLRHPGLFKSGEQGLLNYVINKKAAAGEISLERCNLMLWPGPGVDVPTRDDVARGNAPSIVIHWAGLKRRRIENMAGGEILAMFEKLYYARLSFATARRWRAHADHHLGEVAKAARHQLQSKFRI